MPELSRTNTAPDRVADSNGVAPNEYVRGGRVLFASFLGIGVSMVSLLYYSGGVFIKPLEEAFGWSRAQMGGASFVSIISLIIVAPLVGKLIDRLGLRLVCTISLLLYAGGVFALSSMNGSLIQYYSISAVITAVGVGSSPIAFTRAVSAWFTQNRGMALGISMSSTGLAGILIPPFLTPFVIEHGWRSGYLLLAAIILAATPLVWLWITGSPPKSSDECSDSNTAAEGLSFALARQDRNFWIMGAMFFLIALAVGGLILSFIPLLLDAGLSPAAAGRMGAVLGVSVMIGRLVTGYLIDRIFAPYVAAVLFSLVACGCLTLAFGGVSQAFVAAIALGFAMGAEADLIGYFVCRYFGLRSYGQIYGSQYSLFMLGSGFSPMIAGYIYDTQGSYDMALIGAAACLGLVAFLSLQLSAFPENFQVESESNMDGDVIDHRNL